MGRKSFTVIRAEVIQDDAFTDLSHDAQALWLQMNLEADHYGIVTNVKRIFRAYGFNQEDFEKLKDAGFLLPLDSEKKLFAITHWWAMNSWREQTCKSEHEDEVAQQLCVIGTSKYEPYVLQSEARKTKQPTGKEYHRCIPIYASADRANESAAQMQHKCAHKTNQSNGSAAEGNASQAELSKQSQKNKKENPYPIGAAARLQECPNCHKPATVTENGDYLISVCSKCGSKRLSKTTGEMSDV